MRPPDTTGRGCAPLPNRSFTTSAGGRLWSIREWQKALKLDPRADLLDKLKQALRENDQDIDFDELRRPHFLLRYDGAVNEVIGWEIAIALESEYDELAQEFHFSLPAPVKVTLYTNREFTDVTRAPSWLSALNDGEIRIPIEGLHQLTPEVHGREGGQEGVEGVAVLGLSHDG